MRKFVCTLVLTACLSVCTGCDFLKTAVREVIDTFDFSACVEHDDGTETCLDFPGVE